MLDYYYKVISQKYSISVIAPAIARERNALDIVIYRSLKFLFIFDVNRFSVVMKLEDGTETSIIGGKSIVREKSDEDLFIVLDELVKYTRLRIGTKFFGEN